jgi:hypothetical protein
MMDSDDVDLQHHREITNTAGTPAEDRMRSEGEEGEAMRTDSGPEKAGLKEGDDAWHNDANRSGERGKGSRKMMGGNTPK